MDALKLIAIGATLLAATPAAADPARIDPVSQWRAEIVEASVRFGVPVAWIERVMRAESGGATVLDGRPITSTAGAIGLMQLMPATWGAMRVQLGLGSDPHRPRDNILAGTAYLRVMYDRFGYPGLFAAYNAGPGRYAAHLASGRALPSETRAYLAQVTGERPLAVAPKAPVSVSIFAVLATTPRSAGETHRDVPPAGVFVALSSAIPSQ